MNTKLLKSGFSLVEVLVFITVLGLFFVAAISVTTFSLKNMKFNEHKILATHYAEEGMEWIRNEKEDDWETFVAKGNVSYCINGLSWSTGSCGYTLGAIFKRQATLTNSGSPVSRVETVVKVSWVEGTQTKDVQIKTIFNSWE